MILWPGILLERPPAGFYCIRVLKRFFQLLLVSLGCLHLAGGPYLLVQSIAWAGMLVRYTQQDGLLKGTIDTFSGDKPCALCCKIADSKRHDRGETPALPAGATKLLELIPVTVVTVSPPRFTAAPAVTFAGLDPALDEGGQSPPVPPPRAAA
ncbi:hypothetical protein [Luteolibacter marinus]|uniref:hypothetical protein n=1 Tax=Luteolibacter marinus TaxID=2776705 RepID=UPI001867F060|nr:hypothetical protein [Luteolibacter marinus]